MGVVRRSFLLALSCCAALICAAVFPAAGANAVGPGVSASPRLDVMQVVDGEVLDSTVIGTRVVLVGTFTTVKNPGGSDVTQAYVAAYDINTGQFDAGFRPTLNKPAYAVDTDGAAIFIGGNFTTINGETHRKVAKLTSAGGLVSSFDPQASANVNDLALAHGNVYLTGRFETIDGQIRNSFAAVDASSGEVEAAVAFDFTFSVAAGGVISGKSIAITPDGSKLFLSHTARFINAQERTAIARFDISANSAALSPWQTNLYDDELDRFGGALRPRRLAMAPDGSYFVMVTSGGDRPPAGDTAVRFPVDGGANTEDTWVSRHFDTVLGVAISNDTVFVGGHFQFQEAPGSTDPFPGDKFSNYGFGFGQGPAQLGDEVVQRQQLGALDPVTGKSLTWNPGSDSFLGVQSLTYVPGEGLLVGHDGTRLGGATIGRHALFPLGNDPDPPDPGDDYACTTAVDGNAVVVAFSGQRGTSEQLRQNGSWAATVTGKSSERVNGAVGDSFSVRVKGPEFADPYSEIVCTAGGNPGVTLETTITAPADGSIVAPGQFTLQGDASAPGGIKRVRLTVFDKTNSEYLRSDGTYSSEWSAIDVNLDTPTEELQWSKTLTVNRTGEFNITAKTFANDGSKDGSRAELKITIGANNNAPPVLTPTEPAATVTTSQVRIAGTATDDQGVTSVTFTLREQNQNLYLRGDGTLGNSFVFNTNLSNPGGPSTNWELTLVVPVGEWQATIDARDASGQRDRRTRSFSQIGNTAPPEIAISTGAGVKQQPNTRFTFAGDASAEAGLRSVEVLVRNVVDSSGVQANGSLGTRANYFTLPGNNVGNTTNWSYQTPMLPAGTYDIFARVTDNLGARSTDRTQIIVGPNGDHLPTTTITASLRNQQGFDGLSATLGGSATDDNGVAQVSIGIFDFVAKKWLQTDGTVDSIADPFFATLTNPGVSSTAWTFDFIAPSSGTYYFYVRAIDTSGQADDDRLFASARMYPGDTTPTVTLNLPTDNQVITTGRIGVSGSADDDVALNGVEVLVSNVDTGQFLRSDGSLGSAEWLQASLTNPGADRTNFDLLTNVIPDGTWDVRVRAKDNNGQTTVPVPRIRVTLT